MKKCMAVFLCFVLLLGMSALPVSDAAAASKPKLSATKVFLRPGDSVTLSVSGTKNKVTWSVENKAIATVSKKGVVKGIKAGETKVCAKVGSQTLKCTIVVARVYSWSYKGHRYQLIDAGMTWSKAVAYCKSIGGHLATITSASEQKSVVKALKKQGKKNNYWLGAKKNGKGQFRWVTGEAFKYTCFAPGQPDRSYEKCLMIYTRNNPNTGGDDSYLWNDLVNAGTFGSEPWFGLKNFGIICEWESK